MRMDDYALRTEVRRMIAWSPAACLYDEVFRLLVDARDCLATTTLQQNGRLGWSFVIESGRLTARLTDMTAWVLGHIAVERGEIDLATCRCRYALEARPIHLVPLADGDRHGLPPKMALLLDRSLGLYQRIARLDQ